MRRGWGHLAEPIASADSGPNTNTNTDAIADANTDSHTDPHADTNADAEWGDHNHHYVSGGITEDTDGTAGHPRDLHQQRHACA